MKDIITGENSGNIRIYLNVNTDADPVFNGYFFLEVGGIKFDSGSYSWIHVADWNSDGLFDVLSGETGGKIHLMLNEGTLGSPLFNTKSFVKDGPFGSTLVVGSRSSPTMADWDNDGDLDLLVGNSAGNIRYYDNVGGPTSPVFNGFTNLTLQNGTAIDVGYDAHPDVADWDNDGVIDIITGEFYGTVLYFKAIGPLALNTNAVPEATGGSIDMDLRAGAANGNRNYLILGSLTGTEPGFPLPGGLTILPINWDPFTDLVLGLVNTPVFSNFMGKLNNSGDAAAKLNAPPLPGFAGTVMYFAFTLNNPFDYVSNGASIEITP